MTNLLDPVITGVPADALTVGARIYLNDTLTPITRVQHGRNGRSGDRAVRVTVAGGHRFDFAPDDYLGVETDGLF